MLKIQILKFLRAPSIWNLGAQLQKSYISWEYGLTFPFSLTKFPTISLYISLLYWPNFPSSGKISQEWDSQIPHFFQACLGVCLWFPSLSRIEQTVFEILLLKDYLCFIVFANILIKLRKIVRKCSCVILPTNSLLKLYAYI